MSEILYPGKPVTRTYIFYKDNVLLGYSGGGIGVQCFPDFYKKRRRKIITDVYTGFID